MLLSSLSPVQQLRSWALLAASEKIIILCLGFPQLDTTQKPVSPMPLHVWGNGNAACINTAQLASILVSVQDLAFPWKNATGQSRPSVVWASDDPNVHEVFAKRQKSQSNSFREQSAKLVPQHACL